MTIWILAFVLLACLGLLGHRQGAIRVAGSLLGLIVGALLALPLSGPVVKVLSVLGLKNPFIAAYFAPILVFIIIQIIFKIAAHAVHKKVDVHYRYKAGDLRLMLWERLNSRLGMCLGFVNATGYLLLICAVLYPLSYWTAQMAQPEGNPRLVSLLNRFGRDLHASGFVKPARALDPVKPSFYDAADIAGLIYHNPLAHRRLARYPAFLSLAEREEFLNMAQDAAFQELLDKQAPIGEITSQPVAKAILEKPALQDEIWTLASADLKDLHTFIETGKSSKPTADPIIGRWEFDLNLAIAAMRKARPNLPSTEQQKMRRLLVSAFGNTTFIAGPDQQAFLKDLIRIQPAAAGQQPTTEAKSLRGQWKNEGGRYTLAFVGETPPEMQATLENDRITILGEWTPLVLSRE